MVKGRIHSVETFGSVDGPGIRFVIFVQGCNMRCRYCHNADTWDTRKGDLKSADELLDMAEHYRAYWGKDGGITVSGGEPLLQMDFLIDLFKKAKQRGINTCIDTAGEPFKNEGYFFANFNELIEYTDLLLFDIKHIDAKEHEKLTHRPNDNIKDCLKYLSDINKPIWIRYVLVPGYTDNTEHLKQTREFIASLKNVQKIDVLPYHSMGRYKWEELGMRYTLKSVLPPSEGEVFKAQRILDAKKNDSRS